MPAGSSCVICRLPIFVGRSFLGEAEEIGTGTSQPSTTVGKHTQQLGASPIVSPPRSEKAAKGDEERKVTATRSEMSGDIDS
jgi:hypothetical protein